MTTQQRIAVAVVFVIAVVGGGVLAFALLGGDGSAGATPSPVAAASGTTEPSASLPVDSPAATASLPPSESPSPSASPSASPVPTPTPSSTPTATPAPGEPTVVVLTALKLDAKDDPAGVNRRVAFRAQGTGTVTVALRTLSPQGNATACLSADGERLECTTTAAGALTTETTTRRSDFVLTLRGEGIETPVVEVAISFPARRPAITIENARFDGTLYPDTNGLQLFVSPREAGNVSVSAQWGGHPFNYEIDLLEQGGPGSEVVSGLEAATGVEASLPVTAGNPWKLLLQNTNEGFGVTSLDATIAWP